MNQNRNTPSRQPQGQPTGGQFAAKTSPESEVNLAEMISDGDSFSDDFPPEGSPKMISGSLAGDPEIRYTKAGVAETKLRISDAWLGETTTVTCHGELAENVALSVTEGDQLVVKGAVRYDKTRVDRTDSFLTTIGIDADDVGASLKNSTVDIHRVRPC